MRIDGRRWPNILRQQLTTSTEGLDALTLEGPVKFAGTYPNLKVDWLHQGVWNGQFGDDSDTVDGIGAFQGFAQPSVPKRK